MISMNWFQGMMSAVCYKSLGIYIITCENSVYYARISVFAKDFSSLQIKNVLHFACIFLQWSKNDAMKFLLDFIIGLSQKFYNILLSYLLYSSSHNKNIV